MNAERDLLRPLRYLWRLPLLVLHLFISLPLTLLVVTTFGPHVSFRGERLDHRLIRAWSAGLVRVFGMAVDARGTPLPGAVLLVANHITWMDIEIIHARRMANFVAKSEIAGWPIVGWLTTYAGTIFHRRGDPRSLESVQRTMVERLRDGHAVAVFPEGTTGRGDQIRTFHARIFAVCEAAGVPAQPVGLRFMRAGRPTYDPAFRPGENFLSNFVRLLGSPPTIAELHFLEPLEVGVGGRRRAADVARTRIAETLGLPNARPRGVAESTVDDLDPIAVDDADRR
jgi:1-acyl-sn-glycerol-3-phosphate acyltransferase